MTRLVPLVAVALLGIPGAASAQHYHGGHSGGHYHVVPGHYHRHGDHYDYHPGRIIYHSNPSYYPSQSTYVEPYYVRPSYADSYDGHSYDHQSGSHTTGYRGEYGGFSHIDDLAVQLEQEANLMCLEMHYNYQHNPGYRQTYREAYEILTTAKYIHGLEHAGNRDRIRQAIVELDVLFHHVQDDVRHWTRHSHRYLGQGGLPAKMSAVEETLHHLMNDVGATSEFGGTDDPAGGEVAPPAHSGGSPQPFFQQ